MYMCRYVQRPEAGFRSCIAEVKVVEISLMWVLRKRNTLHC